MLKRRIIPIQLLMDDRLVKSKEFSAFRDVGDPISSSKIYSAQDADELVFLNINRDNQSLSTLIHYVEKIAQDCFVPLTVGGGISKISDATSLFKAGADKVLINTAAYSNPDLIKEIADQFGSQSLVVGFDIKAQNGDYAVFSNCGRKKENVVLGEHIISVISAGAGELMVQSIDRDGKMIGYDLNLLRYVLSISKVPVIAAGGPGNFQDLKDAFDVGVDAVSAGSLFNFGDNNPLRAKAFLKNYNIKLKKI